MLSNVPMVSNNLALNRANLFLHQRMGGVRFYDEKVIDHFNNPRNVGTLDKTDKNVGTAFVGKASCGDVIKLQIKVDEKTGLISDAKFKTFGCGSAIASSSLATEKIKGKNLQQALGFKNTEIADYLKLPPVKIHCSLLAEEAIHAAVKDYQEKRGGEEASVMEPDTSNNPRGTPGGKGAAAAAGAAGGVVKATLKKKEQTLGEQLLEKKDLPPNSFWEKKLPGNSWTSF
jgi:Fe-S cluster assembly scaffold IscU